MVFCSYNFLSALAFIVAAVFLIGLCEVVPIRKIIRRTLQMITVWMIMAMILKRIVCAF